MHWSKNPQLKAEVLAKISAGRKGKCLGNTNGFTKGDSAWNKGLTKETNETIKKIAEKRYKPLSEKKGWLEYGYKVLSIEGRRILEHHYVWMNHNGLPWIPKGYVVHHIDENKLNNDPENLVLLTRAQHTEVHHALGSTNPYGWKDNLNE